METLASLLSSDSTYALLDDSKSPKSKSKNLLFSNPQHEIIATKKSDLRQALEKVEQYKKQGLYLCGYLSYEAGYAFLDKKINRKIKTDQHPLLYFIAFKDLQRPDRDEVEACFKKATLYPESEICLHDLSLNTKKSTYLKAISKIKSYINAGDTYQINYTLKYKFKLQGTAVSLYKALRKKQPVEFGALLNFPQSKIVSLSPELFVKKSGSTITSKPMKGTAKRGINKKEDSEIVNFLKNDPKTRSENVMIVDLIRNDFGRVCKTGSVHVKNLFEVQTFKTLHQVISTVKGKLKKKLSFSDLLHALYPCGSITGAPKIRTMEIINELEAEPRGIYTGAIGYLMPDDDFYFNVPIRTIAIDENSHCEMGIGSGIIYESNAEAEYDECLLKGEFLTNLNSQFYLIETFKFDGVTQDYINLDKHLERLIKSAKYFGFEVLRSLVLKKLVALKEKLKSSTYKIRLTAFLNGDVELSHELLLISDNTEEKVITISSKKIDSSSIFQYHKTSKREIYNEEYDKAVHEGYYEAIVLNEFNEVAEACRHNIFIRIKGKWYTPPLSAGILNGVERQNFIQDT